MKVTMKKSLAVIMALVMCVSVLFGINLSVFAADTNTVTYVYDGDYVYNWGAREEEATFLSTMAEAFYSKNNVSLSALLALDGSSSESGVPSSTLYQELQTLMESNHDYINSYEAIKTLCMYTDCQNSGGKISSFYSGKAIGPSWNSSEWNREHTWPNSKGDKAGSGENDIMMIRPTSVSENSSRLNKAYGTETTASYYNPNDQGAGAYDLRGDVARIILYQYVRWNCTNTGSKYNSTSIFGANGVIESKSVLLDWIEADPVDTWELGRNDSVEAITGTRNVFVDYPELAFDLFGVEIPKHQTPSGYANINGTTEDVVVDDDTTTDDGNAGDEGNASTDSGTITYEIIDAFENLTAGTYKMSAYCTSNSGTDFSANPYHCATGNISSGDLVTNVYSFSGGNLIQGTPPSTKHTGDAVDVTLTAVADKANTYYIYVADKGYLYSSSAANRKLAFSADPVEWVASNHTNGGITMTGSGVSMGSAGASSAIIRSYTAASTLKYGLFFFKATANSGDEGGDETEAPADVFTAQANDDTYGTVTTTDDVVTVTARPGYKLSETESYTVEGGTATVTNNGDGTYTISDVVGDATITFNFELEDTTINGYYVKVEGSLDNWTGEYLIVYEDEEAGTAIALNAALDSDAIDKTSNNFPVAVDGKKIVKNSATEAAQITIAPLDGGYTFQTPNGSYIGNNSEGSSSNIVSSSKSTNYKHTISYVDGKLSIYNNKNTLTLQYNATNNIFRYYSSVQKPISLYKYIAEYDAASTVTASTAAGGTVAKNGNVIFAQPETHMVIDNEAPYNVTGSATVVRNGGMFIVTDAVDANVQINFTNRVYTLCFKENGSVISTIKGTAGDIVELPDSIGNAGNGEFLGWALENTTEIVTEHEIAGNATFVAVYASSDDGNSGESSSYYEKVTTTPTDWSGEYLIVYEDGSVAFDGSLKADTTNGTIAVEINDGKIYESDETIASRFTIAEMDGGYSIKSASGYYIYNKTSKADVVYDQSAPHLHILSLNSNATVGIQDANTNKYINFNSNSGQNRFRYYNNTQKAVTLYKFVEVGGSVTPTAEIKGAQVEVGDDLSVNYYVSTSNIADPSTLAMQFTIEGFDTISVDTKELVGNYYVFNLNNIPPQHMTDNIKADVLVDGETIATLENYSIQQNSKNLLAAYPDNSALKRFISDMLHYGDAAQIYRGYKTDNKATTGVDVLPAQADAPDRLRGVLSGETTGTACFGSATVWFDAVNRLIVKIKNPENLEKVVVEVDGQEIQLAFHDATQGYITDGIKATDFDTEYVFKIYETDNATPVQTLTYSVNAYASSKYDSDKSTAEMKQLALALYNYGVSAKAYAESLK